MQIQYVSVALVDPDLAASASSPAGSAAASTGGPQPWLDWMWRKAVDPETAEAIRQRNEAFATRLMAALPDLEREGPNYEPVHEWISEEGLSEGEALARIHRLITLNDRTQPRTLGIEIADGTASVFASAWDTDSPAETERLRDRFEAAARTVAEVTGFLPYDANAGAFLKPHEAGPLAARLLAGPAADLRLRARRVWAGFIVINLIIAAVIAGMAWASAERARLVRDVNPERPLTFVVHGQLPVSHILRLIPDLKLAGVIRETGAAATLDVYRDAWISAQRGTAIMVFATGWPAEPYLSIDEYASLRPLVRAGPVIINGLAVLTAGVLALWIGWLVFGYRRNTPMRRAIIRSRFSRTGLYILSGAVIVILVTLARRIL